VKAKFEQIAADPGNSFSILQISQPHFDATYHFHPELELTLILEGKGQRYIGGEVSDYESGDLVLVGENIPHCWMSDILQKEMQASAIVFQFQKNFVGEIFWQLPEMAAIQALLERAGAGILISGFTSQQISAKMKRCATVSGFERLNGFLEILQIIAVSQETVLIDPLFSVHGSSAAEAGRFQTIFSYLIENYRQDISLRTLADISHLTPTAFCRYFKNVTHKTLMEVVTDFRINHACQLLRSTDKPVFEICFESGFGHISHFNKTYKNATGKTPLQYRKLFGK